MGGIQNTYLRYESAGDMYVGRTVCGLPSDSYNFTVLPPHFIEKGDVVAHAMKILFPQLPKQLTYVAESAFASLVYHVAFLKRHLQENHRLFKTPLFQDKEMLVELSKRIKCDFSSPVMKATGLPPHTKILAQMKELEETLTKMLEAIERNRVQIVKQIIHELIE